MSATAIVGANWGDEGKGKITDAMAADSAFVVRFQGGSNAGHTILNEYGRFALHMLPSGVFHPQVTNVIGPGAALDAETLLTELAELKAAGVPAPKLRVSDRAQLVLPVHRALDGLEEDRLGSQGFGSTRRGIAPFYSDKYAKLGIQMSDLFDADRLRMRLEKSLTAKNVLLENLYGAPTVEAAKVMPSLLVLAEKLRQYADDTTVLLQEAYESGKTILLEGQLGALRDPDHGIYPFTTSSSTLAGYASVGAGLPPYAITNIIAVVKAYSSCVGAGPFITELHGEEAETLRRLGGDSGEYGATTGRPRRVGWFDAVATRYGCRLQGTTTIALTNMDVLGYFPEIPVCIGYQLPEGVTKHFPVSAKLDEAQPVYRMLPGWNSDLSGARHLSELPAAARGYISFVEETAGVKVGCVSVGPRREQTIWIN
ncbi:adenylosuccinate synthase [Cohnella sp. OV330]|uniref:adenylosuccinate synthase n=1 Tax=Cohnella sp. OV330 TaxID=1855288 RepID=UPI000B7E5C07|nr:adenylosuccinate synthase [Cohnella sp. OV330]